MNGLVTRIFVARVKDTKLIVKGATCECAMMEELSNVVST